MIARRAPRFFPPPLPWLATLALVPLLVAIPLAAQEPTDTVQVDSAGLAAPISAGDFAQQEQAAYALIRRIERTTDPDTWLQGLAQGLIETSATIEVMSGEPEAVSPSRYPVRRVTALRTEWAALHDRLEEWREELGRHLVELDDYRSQLRDTRRIVQLSDSILEVEGGSTLLEVRHTELLQQLDSTMTHLDGTIEGTLVMQDRAVADESRVESQLATFDAELRRQQAQLLAIDSPPLWAIGAETVMAPSRGAGTSLDSLLAAISAFYEDYRATLVLQLLLVLFATLGLVTFRRRAGAWLEDREAGAPIQLLRHPFATALMLGVLTTPVAFSAPPVEITDLALLISIFPTVVLLRGLVRPVLRPALYATCAMMVIQLISANLDWVPVLGRLLLLGETALAIAGLAWVVRKDSPARVPDGTRWWSATLAASRVAILLLIVSLGANVLGNRSLAEFLTGGVVRAAYLGVLLYATAIVGHGLVAMLPRTSVGTSLHALTKHRDLIVARLQKLVTWAVFFVWVYFAFRAFNLWGFVGDRVVTLLQSPVGIGPFQITAGSVLLFVVAIVLTYRISQFTRFVLAEEVLERLDLPKGIPVTISTLTHYIILLLGLAVALAVAGIDLTSLGLVAGALGVGIGFGLQGLVNNFVSGLILVFERPLSVGDAIQMGTVIGRVQRIGMRSTTVLTYDGAEVIVPNGNLIANEVTNWTLTDRRRRVEVRVGVKYGTDPTLVLKLLLEVAQANDEILGYPEPTSVFLGFGDSSLDFALRAWTRTFEEHFRVQSDLTVAVNAALKDADIEIPFPQRDLYIKSMPADGSKPEEEALGSDAVSEALEPEPEPR